MEKSSADMLRMKFMLDPHVREEEVGKRFGSSGWLFPDSFPEEFKIGIREFDDVVDVHG